MNINIYKVEHSWQEPVFYKPYLCSNLIFKCLNGRGGCLLGSSGCKRRSGSKDGSEGSNGLHGELYLLYCIYDGMTSQVTNIGVRKETGRGGIRRLKICVQDDSLGVCG